MTLLTLRFLSRGEGTQSLTQVRGAAEFLIYDLIALDTNLSVASGVIGMYTFPGGVYEESDGNLFITAFREMFEETGVLFGNHSPATIDIPHWRTIIHQSPARIHELLSLTSPSSAESSILGSMSSLGSSSVPSGSSSGSSCYHFCSFQTPNFEKKKYLTLFFLKEAMPSDYSSMSADGAETSSLTWIEPSKALELNSFGKMIFLPPQFYILSELQAAQTCDQLFHQLSLNQINQSLGGEPSPPLQSCHSYHPNEIYQRIDSRGYPVLKPAPISSPKTTDEELILTLPYDEKHPEFPGPEGERHRITCTLPMGVKGYHLEKSHSFLSGLVSSTS